MKVLISLSSFGAAETGRHGQLWCTDLAQQAGADGVEVRGELLRDAAVQGMGITYLPTFIVGAALKDGRLVPVLDEFRPEPLTLSAVYPQHRQSSRPVQALIEEGRYRRDVY